MVIGKLSEPAPVYRCGFSAQSKRAELGFHTCPFCTWWLMCGGWCNVIFARGGAETCHTSHRDHIGVVICGNASHSPERLFKTALIFLLCEVKYHFVGLANVMTPLEPLHISHLPLQSQTLSYFIRIFYVINTSQSVAVKWKQDQF